jgi:hypothetical protein
MALDVDKQVLLGRRGGRGETGKPYELRGKGGLSIGYMHAGLLRIFGVMPSPAPGGKGLIRVVVVFEKTLKLLRLAEIAPPATEPVNSGVFDDITATLGNDGVFRAYGDVSLVH